MLRLVACVRSLVVLLAVAFVTVGAAPRTPPGPVASSLPTPTPGPEPEPRIGAHFAAAQSGLDAAIRLAVYRHFESRIGSEACEQYFSIYAMDAKNWLLAGDTVKVQVQFMLEFRGHKTLYGRSERARQCLGRDAGEGFFQVHMGYLSAGYIYTLSRWETGWHVDKVEPQP